MRIRVSLIRLYQEIALSNYIAYLMLEATIVLDMNGMHIKEKFNGLLSKTFRRMVGTVIAHHYFPRNVFSCTTVLEENLI